METLERLIKTVHALQSRQTMYESLFTGRTSVTYEYYSQMHGKQGLHHYAINSMLYLGTIKEKFISQLHMYVKVIRILAIGYLPISLIAPIKLKEI